MITKYDRWGGCSPFLVGECQLSFAIYTIDTGLLTGGKMKDSTNVEYIFSGQVRISLKAENSIKFSQVISN